MNEKLKERKPFHTKPTNRKEEKGKRKKKKKTKGKGKRETEREKRRETGTKRKKKKAGRKRRPAKVKYLILLFSVTCLWSSAWTCFNSRQISSSSFWWLWKKNIKNLSYFRFVRFLPSFVGQSNPSWIIPFQVWIQFLDVSMVYLLKQVMDHLIFQVRCDLFQKNNFPWKY